MSFLVIWLVLAVIVGVAANTRGRNHVGWTLLAAVISPLIAGLLVLALPHHVETEHAVDDEALRQNSNRAQAVGSQRGIGFGGWAVVACGTAPRIPCRAVVWAIVLATAPYLSSARPAPSPAPPTSPAAAPAFAPIRNPEFAKKKSATSVDAAAAAGAARSAPRARGIGDKGG
jgi:hypothetical protein